MKKDTTPRPFSNKALVALILPLFFEVVFNAAIGSFDTIMVSSCGETAVSGVSLIDSIMNIFVYVVSAFATSGAVVASQYIGRGDRKMASRAAKNLIEISVAIVGAIALLLILFRSEILSFVYRGIEEDVKRNALLYVLPVASSLPFLAILNSSNAIARSMGRTRTTFRVSLVMNAMNITGNAIFIYVLGLGPLGAGLASLMSRIVAASIMLAVLTDKEKEIYIERPFRIEVDRDVVRRIVAIAVPAGTENIIFHGGKLLVASMVASLGTVAIAANAVHQSVTDLMHMPGTAIAMASVTVIGQCMGRGDTENARYYQRKLLLWSLGGLFLMGIAVLFGAPVIVGLFGLGAEATALATRTLRLFSLVMVFLWAFSFVTPHMLRAVGDAVYTMKVSMFSMLLFRIVFSYILGIMLGLGLIGIHLGMYMDWVCRGTLFLTRLGGRKWEKNKVI